MILGLVTYNLGKDMTLPELLENCAKTGFGAVELRTTHAHGVELSLGPAERAEVKARFADSPVVLWGLGTTCEFDSPEQGRLQAQIDEARRWLELAHEVGARGVKVRPNNLHDGVEPAQTCHQIGAALGELGPHAQAAGVSLYLEVHGRGTHDPKLIRQMMDVAPHPHVGVCWNSNHNAQEVIDGRIASTFGLVAERINSCHITELWSDYPWRELFRLLRDSGYAGATLAEIPESADPLRLMRYYRALWQALQPT